MASAPASGTGDGLTIPLILVSLNGTCGQPDISSQSDCVTILSAGEHSEVPELHGKHSIDISVRDFWDPDSGRYSSHVGRYPRILEGLQNTNVYNPTRVLKQALDIIEAYSNNNCVIIFRCRSNRHRTIYILALLCELTNINFELNHLAGQPTGQR